MSAGSGFVLMVTDGGSLTANGLSVELDKFGWIDASVERGGHDMVRIDPHRGDIGQVLQIVEATVENQGYIPNVHIKN
jgi:hypothetical protein